MYMKTNILRVEPDIHPSLNRPSSEDRNRLVILRFSNFATINDACKPNYQATAKPVGPANRKSTGAVERRTKPECSSFRAVYENDPAWQTAKPRARQTLDRGTDAQTLDLMIGLVADPAAQTRTDGSWRTGPRARIESIIAVSWADQYGVSQEAGACASTRLG